jgi:hypothetical protein
MLVMPAVVVAVAVSGAAALVVGVALCKRRAGREACGWVLAAVGAVALASSTGALIVGNLAAMAVEVQQKIQDARPPTRNYDAP